MIALFDSRAGGNGLVPAQNVGVGAEVDRLPLVAGDPGPRRHVGDRVVACEIFGLAEPLVENAIETLGLGEIALFRVRRLALVVFHEVMHLAEHGADTAHLPHQPLDRVPVRLGLLGPELPGLFGEVHEDRARFEQREARVVVDDGGNAIVGADLQEVGLELVTLADVDGVRSVLEAAFLEHDRDLAAVGGRPSVEIDHRASLELEGDGAAARADTFQSTLENGACPCNRRSRTGASAICGFSATPAFGAARGSRRLICRMSRFAGAARDCRVRETASAARNGMPQFRRIRKAQSLSCWGKARWVKPAGRGCRFRGSSLRASRAESSSGSGGPDLTALPPLTPVGVTRTDHSNKDKSQQELEPAPLAVAEGGA